MDFYKPYQKKLDRLFDEAIDQLSCYPTEYISVAEKLIRNQNPSVNGKGNYIAFLLPFWIQDEFALDDFTVGELVKANIFKVVCAGIQDKVMDSKKKVSKYAKLLPLSNLFFVQFYQIYQSLFTSGNKSWDYLQGYFVNYAEAAIYEHDLINDVNIDLLTMDLKILADKASPIKHVVTSACLLTGREDEIDGFNILFDKLLISLQLLDDWIDIEKDWKDRSMTPVLKEVLQFNQVGALEDLTQEMINGATVFGKIDEKLIKVGKRHKDYLVQNGIGRFECAEQFHHYILNRFVEIRDENKRAGENILMGGFLSVIGNSTQE